MNFDAEVRVFLIYAAAILIVFLFGRILLVPVKILFKVLGNVLLAAAVITVFVCLLNETAGNL